MLLLLWDSIWDTLYILYKLLILLNRKSISWLSVKPEVHICRNEMIRRWKNTVRMEKKFVGLPKLRLQQIILRQRMEMFQQIFRQINLLLKNRWDLTNYKVLSWIWATNRLIGKKYGSHFFVFGFFAKNKKKIGVFCKEKQKKAKKFQHFYLY